MGSHFWQACGLAIFAMARIQAEYQLFMHTEPMASIPIGLGVLAYALMLSVACSLAAYEADVLGNIYWSLHKIARPR